MKNIFLKVFSLSVVFGFIALGASAAKPVLMSLDPNNTPEGSPGMTITLDGSNFVSGSTVTYDGKNRTVHFISSAELNVDLLGDDFDTAGVYDVTVTSPQVECDPPPPPPPGIITIVKTADGGVTSQTFTFNTPAGGTSTGITSLTPPVGGTTNDSRSVVEGDSYAISENPPPTGWVLTQPVCHLEDGTQTGIATADKMGVTDIDVFSGEETTCTFVNTYTSPKARLTLVKNVINDSGGTTPASAWTLAANGPTPISGLTGTSPVTNAQVDPGTYNLSESGGPSGYSASTWSCVRNGVTLGSSTSILLQAGNNATCTITNNDLGATLTLNKVVSGGTAPASAWTLKATGQTPTSTPLLSGPGPQVTSPGPTSSAPFKAGTYVLSETGPSSPYAGYVAGTWSCTGGGTFSNGPSGPQIVLAPGQTASCSITNTYAAPGTLYVAKWIGTGRTGPTVQFDYVGNFGATISVTSAGTTGATNSVSRSIAAGTYSISEIFPSGWNLAGANCAPPGQPTPPESTWPPLNGPLTFTISPNQATWCTFRNNYSTPPPPPPPPGSIRIVKNITGATSGTFNFTVNPGNISQSITLPATNQWTISNLTPGPYTVTESNQSGWTLNTMQTTCSNGTSSNGYIWNVNVISGQQTTCTFTNAYTPPPPPPGTIVIIKSIDPINSPPSNTQFNFVGSGTIGAFSLAPPTTTNYQRTVTAGTYSITESTPPSSWALYSATCNNGNSPAAVTVGSNQTVTCTFTNRYTPLSDIAVTEFTVPDGAPGGLVNSSNGFRLKVKNLSTTTPTPSGFKVVVHKNVGTPPANPTPLLCPPNQGVVTASTTVGVLQPLQEIDLSNLISFNRPTTAGDYWATAFAESDCVIAETNESNNNAFDDYKARNRPDLIVTNVDIPTGTPGQAVTANVTIQNTGPVATTTGFMVALNLDQSTMDCTTVEQYELGTPILNAGASRTIPFAINLSKAGNPLAAGTYTSVAMVDSDCQITNATTPELDETNNTMTESHEVTAPTLPDIEMLNLQPLAGNPGQTVNASIQIRNNGSNPINIPFDIAVKLNATTLNTGGPHDGLQSTGTMTAGETRTVSVPTLIPASMAAGTYQMVALADWGGVVSETNETNNMKTNTLTVSALPTVTISANNPNAAEPNINGQFTVTRTGSTTTALTVNISQAGSATNGSDYSNIGTTVTIPTGSATNLINVSVIDDTLVEGTESVIITVANGTGYSPGTPSQATVNIADNDSALPTVTVTASTPNAAEPGTNGAFTITRTGSTAAALSVSFSVGGTASPGSDYGTINSPLNIPAGFSSVNVSVNVINDTLVEGNETVVLTLNGTSGYSVGSPSSATVTIADDDVAAGQPDLVVLAPFDILNGNANFPGSVNVIVKNQGAAAAGPFSVGLHRTVNLNSSCSILPEYSINWPGLGAGAQATVTISFNYPATIGGKTASAMADSAPCTVNEGVNEGNNSRTDAYTVSVIPSVHKFAQNNNQPTVTSVSLASKLNASLVNFFTAETVYAATVTPPSNCSATLPFTVTVPSRQGPTTIYGKIRTPDVHNR